MNNSDRFTTKLAESAVMLALATILSFVKLIDLPYGGSITLASMLPILIIAYRHNVVWGLATGFVHGVIQFAIGSSVLSYVTGWQSVLAVILLDYFVAFAVIGLGGLTRKIKDQRVAVGTGAVIAGVLRYVCHVISGATVWAGLSIPDAAALKYSFIYNATYMIPETIVLVLSAVYLCSAVDFSGGRLRSYKVSTEKKTGLVTRIVAGALVTGALVFDVAMIFGKLQNAETGEFDITGISSVNWPLIAIVTAAAVIIAVVVFVVSKAVMSKKEA